MVRPTFSLFRGRRRLRRWTEGGTLPATMMVILVILAFISTAALVTSQNRRYAGRQQGKTDILAAADAALEYAYSQWKASVAATIHGNKTNIPPASTWPSSSLVSKFNAVYGTAGTFATSTGITLPTGAIVIRSVDQNGLPVKDAGGNDVSLTAAPTGVATNNVPGYPGWAGTTYNYMATVTVNNQTHYGRNSSDGAVTVNRYFQVTTVPLFQAAIFYENTLELHPGAKMVVTGLVHSNDSVYALGYAATLQFMNNVSYVGKYKEGSNPAVRYGWDGSNKSASNVPDAYAAYFPNYWADGQPTASSTSRSGQINQVSTIDPFGGASQNNNGLHDIVEVPAKNNNSDQIAYNNASLIIEVDSSKNANSSARYNITDGAGKKLSAVDEAAVTLALTSTAPTTFTDQREAATVTVTSLDMAKLALATVLPSTGTATGLQSKFGGTVYIHDVAPTTASTRTAIRLVNGRNLGQNVSIATDNGLYIQGDYNTGGKQPSDVPTNGTGTSPEAATYDRYSSSVMADAVTILSNNWSDTNSGSSLSSRKAVATTVNTAILAGDVPSNNGGNGIASGGAHNFPRFLEDWTNINFTYYGSLVEAFRSEKFTGNWQTNNVYHWPNRLWNFDTTFLTKQPPGVPTGIQFSRGRYERAIN